MKLPILGVLLATSLGCSAANEPVAERGEFVESDPDSLCVAVSRPELVARALRGPITPPVRAAGIDFSRGGTWPGFSIENAQHALCLATQQSGSAGLSEDIYAWGEHRELALSVDKITHLVTRVAFRPGYSGRASFHSRAGGAFGAHDYVLGVGAPVLRDGAAWSIDWSAPAAVPAVNELHDALVATFAPGVPADGENCVARGTCIHAVHAMGDGTNESDVGSNTVHFQVHISANGTVTAATMIPER